MMGADDSRIIGELSGRMMAVERTMGEHTGTLNDLREAGHETAGNVRSALEAISSLSQQLQQGLLEIARLQRGLRAQVQDQLAEFDRVLEAKRGADRAEFTKLVAPLRTVAKRVRRYEMTVGAAVGGLASIWFFFGDFIKEKVHKLIG